MSEYKLVELCDCVDNGVALALLRGCFGAEDHVGNCFIDLNRRPFYLLSADVDGSLAIFDGSSEGIVSLVICYFSVFKEISVQLLDENRKRARNQ